MQTENNPDNSWDKDYWYEDDPENEDDWSDDFDYESYVEQNFPDHVANTQTRTIWRWVSVVLLIAFAFSLILSILR